MLADAQNVLVNIAGGPALTLNEVQILMDELGKQISDCAQILFGTAVDAKMGNKVSVSIITSIGDGQPASSQRAVPRQSHVQVSTPVSEPEPVSAPVIEAYQEEPEQGAGQDLESEPILQQVSESVVEPVYEQTAEPEASYQEESVSAYAEEEQQAVAGEIEQSAQASLLDMPAGETVEEASPEQPAEPQPVMRPRKFTFPVPARPIVQAPPVVTRKPAPEPRQETLQFEPVTRGRFEKSEPTIVDGQDLDVPTFLRRNVKVK